MTLTAGRPASIDDCASVDAAGRVGASQRRCFVDLSRTPAGIGAALLATALLTDPVSAAPGDTPSTRDFGNGPERNEIAALDTTTAGSLSTNTLFAEEPTAAWT